MENKSLFTSIVLAIALAATYFFFNNKVEELNQEINTITQEYNAKISAVAPIDTKSEVKEDLSALESLNTQLIDTRSKLESTRKELLLAKSKASVLSDEIRQISDARDKVKLLKTTLKSTQEQLDLSSEKVDFLQKIFKKQNTEQVAKNISRISTLKETSTGIAVTGLIVPAIGAATLVSYTVEEIKNYCANVKNIMTLEEKVFGKVISLDKTMQKDYQQQCVVSFKEKIKKQIKKLEAKK